MSRPLITIACVYLTGLVLGWALIYFPVFVLTLLCLATLGEFLLRRQCWVFPRSHLLTAVLLTAMVYAYFIAWNQDSSDISRLINRDKVTLIGTIDEPLIHYPDWSVVILKAQSIRVGEHQETVTGRVRLRGSGPYLGQYQYGDILQVHAKLSAPRGFLNPGLFNFGEYLRRHGIVAEATVSRSEEVFKIGEQPFMFLRVVYIWREKIRGAALEALKDEPLAIFLAMIIGETGYLTNTIRDQFMASGTTHILSISGSHLGLVAIVVFSLTRLAILHLPQGWLLRMGLYFTASQLAALVTAFPVVFYALLAGGQIATIRSLIMILVYLLAVLIRREDNLLNALALAAILVLLWDPRAIGDISFQLSYGSVLIIALAVERFRCLTAPQHFRQKIVNKIRLYFVITVAATLGTAPLVAYHFNQISLVGIFSNLLVIPAAGLVIVPLGLFCAVGSLFMEHAILPLADILQTLYGLFYGVVGIFSQIPWAELRVASPSLPLLVGLYFSLAYLVSPSKFNLRVWGIRWVLPALVLLLPLVGMAKDHLPGFSKPLRITFLDVGQGDSAVVQFPDGQVMVVDGGRIFGEFDLGRLVVAPYLWDQGIHHIHYLIASHPQLDHIGGLVFLIRRFSIEEVWTNGAKQEGQLYQRFKTALSQRGLTERKVFRQASDRTVGPCLVQVLHPASEVSIPAFLKLDRSSLSGNNRSIVLKISCYAYSFILPGDIEEAAELELSGLGDVLQSTVIKVPHHGSRGSLESTFLERMSPKVAVISVGARNPYGHPAAEALAAYQRLGSQVFRTDHQGAIQIEASEDHLQVRQFSDWMLRPVEWGPEMVFTEWENMKRLVRPSSSLELDKG
jgi:competence protein ComEC